MFTAFGTWRQRGERLENLDMEEIKSSCRSQIMKPTRKARANMCKATLKKQQFTSQMQVSQDCPRRSQKQLLAAHICAKGSGGRYEGRGEWGGGTLLGGEQ